MSSVDEESGSFLAAWIFLGITKPGFPFSLGGECIMLFIRAHELMGSFEFRASMFIILWLLSFSRINWVCQQ